MAILIAISNEVVTLYFNQKNLNYNLILSF